MFALSFQVLPDKMGNDENLLLALFSKDCRRKFMRKYWSNHKAQILVIMVTSHFRLNFRFADYFVPLQKAGGYR